MYRQRPRDANHACRSYRELPLCLARQRQRDADLAQAHRAYGAHGEGPLGAWVVDGLEGNECAVNHFGIINGRGRIGAGRIAIHLSVRQSVEIDHCHGVGDTIDRMAHFH